MYKSYHITYHARQEPEHDWQLARIVATFLSPPVPATGHSVPITAPRASYMREPSSDAIHPQTAYLAVSCKMVLLKSSSGTRSFSDNNLNCSVSSHLHTSRRYEKALAHFVDE
jgi:hypothetical protein